MFIILFRTILFCFCILSVQSTPAKYVDESLEPNSRQGRHGGLNRFLHPGFNILSYLQSDFDLECPFPYIEIGGVCLFAQNNCTSADPTYVSARNFCQTLGNGGGDLVVFRNANDFSATVDYLNLIDPTKLCSYYVGASDANVEGVWEWVYPSMQPFSRSAIEWTVGQPDGFVSENFAVLDRSNYYRLSDKTSSNSNTNPICRIFPKKHRHVTFE